ncbi:two-component system alkaline phosphatase synthesis response regulator PhoP/two-component system response regulator CssR [Hypnocyclicus thermotrophus]|uniref:Two-component system alkaline phosphatase synthesis response regulator PhoP/two-component system response regulator CssR n=1 Tax=Hypnocyclicus thermotrophus TaxID=1627895 RepID=A0AA46DYW3_9FUSO|nr:response regulator transcription factor [Hypnocyclicus thermotrophus]TDT70465.1 two-component system alkaline phosphatase synthesis response regulator PhoP/two-component system response regulator CssR [Hypnocyclicus thermotrophus]
MNILIVDDCIELANKIKETFDKSYTVYIEHTPNKVLDIVSSNEIDLIIMDIDLGHSKNGFDLIREIRNDADNYGIPYIFALTAKKQDFYEEMGYNLGVDDYLKKPFRLKILNEKVKILAKRIKKSTSNLQYGNLILKSDTNEILIEDNNFFLNDPYFSLLEFLILNKNINLSRKKIFENIWPEEIVDNYRRVDVTIKRLKDKVPYIKDKIETIYGFGYKLIKI